MTDHHAEPAPLDASLPTLADEIGSMPSAELDIAQRRELALVTMTEIGAVLDLPDVTVGALEEMVDSRVYATHIQGERALRCIESLAREDSAVAKVVGENGVYHYAEGVVTFGANENKFLELMERHGLGAEQVTGLYALRELIGENTEGDKIGFASIEEALRNLGISVQDAATNPDNALEALDIAGYFSDTSGRMRFRRPRMLGHLAVARRGGLVEGDPSGEISLAVVEAWRSEEGLPVEERPDDNDIPTTSQVILDLKTELGLR